ncbi:uncharacterized protein [Hetaerina americana]
MSDLKLPPELRESFRRELELLNSMGLMNEDAGEIETGLSNLSLAEEGAKLVVYGPLPEAFYVVNCPFVWSEYVSTEEIEDHMTEMLSELSDQEWRTFCFQIYAAFLASRSGKLSEAFKHLENCEELLSKKAEDEFFKGIMEGLTHCTQAVRAHLHFLNGDAEMADEIISGVAPLKRLGNPAKAALIALNAEVLGKFGLLSKRMAVKLLESAIKLDPDECGSRRGAWYYSLGKLHGQLRRIKHRAGMPSKEELRLLERAVKINPFAVSLATLADSYREASTSGKFGNEVQITDKMCGHLNSEAKKLYIKALELDSQTYSTLRRCGNGLMKLPAPHKDIPLAKDCLEKAGSLNPQSSAVYQSLGTLEEKHFKNLEGALKYFQLSYKNGNVVAACFMIQVRMKMDKNYNPIDDIDGFIKDQVALNRPELNAKLLILKGEYLFFLRNDFLGASKFWKEAITLSPNSENITNHVTRLLQGRWAETPYLKYVAGRYVLNVYECLKCEIRKALVNPKYSDEDKVYLRDLLKSCEDGNAATGQ